MNGIMRIRISGAVLVAILGFGVWLIVYFGQQDVIRYHEKLLADGPSSYDDITLRIGVEQIPLDYNVSAEEALSAARRRLPNVEMIDVATALAEAKSLRERVHDAYHRKSLNLTRDEVEEFFLWMPAFLAIPVGIYWLIGSWLGWIWRGFRKS